MYRTTLPAEVPLNNSSLKGDSLEFRPLEGDVAGSDGKIAAVMAAAVALAMLIAFILGRLC